MKYLFLGVFSFLFFTSLNAQTQPIGSIRGEIKTKDDHSASYVNVLIKEKNITISTDENGLFLIKNLSPGSYHLMVSLIGYESQEQEVLVRSDTEEHVSFQLRFSRKELDNITVVDNQRRFVKPFSTYVAKMPLKSIENPQVYTTVTSALMQDQLIVSYSDALKNVPGVIMQLENNNAGGTVTSRGFSTQSYLRNGVPGIIGGGTLEIANIESIEAIKGPSGTMFGSSLVSFGGLFNRVTKKPYSSFGGNVGYIAGGFGLNRLFADINTPLNKDRTMLLRTNAVAYHEGNFQDAGFKSYVFVAPSFTYIFSDKSQLNIEAEYKKERANSFYRLFADGSYATGVRSVKDLKIDFDRRFSGNDIYQTTTTANIFAELKHKFSSHWTSQTLYTQLSGNSNGANGYLSLKPGNDSLSRIFGYADYSNSSAIDAQQNFTGDFSLGKMRNRLLLGLDFYNTISESSSPGTIVYDVVSATDPGLQYTQLNKNNLLDKLKGNASIRTKSIQNIYAAYAQDVLNITDRFLVLASLRVDHFQNKGTKNINMDTTTGRYNQTALSLKFGTVYQIISDRLSFFANYMNGFQNVAPVLQPDGTTSTFKPSKANQWEIGFKAASPDGKLSGNVSYYDISVSNITRSDAPDRPAYTVQNGTQYSKGIEGDVTFSPIDGLFIVGGYAHNDSKLEKSSPATDGFRPVSAGPKDMANLWISYKIGTGLLKGFGIGFGGNHASENAVIASKTTYYTLPAYTALGASLSYDQPKFRLTAKLDNITNEKYWVGWGTTIPQMPLRFSAGGIIKF